MSAARHKAKQWLAGLTRYLESLRKRLAAGAMSEDSAARVAVEIADLMELRKKAAAASKPKKGGGSRLEYDEELTAQLAKGWGEDAAKAPW